MHRSGTLVAGSRAISSSDNHFAVLAGRAPGAHGQSMGRPSNATSNRRRARSRSMGVGRQRAYLSSAPRAVRLRWEHSGAGHRRETRRGGLPRSIGKTDLKATDCASPDPIELQAPTDVSYRARGGLVATSASSRHRGTGVGVATVHFAHSGSTGANGTNTNRRGQLPRSREA